MIINVSNKDDLESFFYTVIKNTGAGKGKLKHSIETLYWA